MTRYAAWPLVLISILWAFASFACAADTDRKSQEDDIREAVFRYLFDHNLSGQQSRAHAYCLAIMVGDKKIDPSDRFMERFAHNKPPVRKASACHWTEIQVENRKGRPALIFFESEIDWVSDVEVTVSAGYEEANVSSSTCPYVFRKENGAWKVAIDGGACTISRTVFPRPTGCPSCISQ